MRVRVDVGGGSFLALCPCGWRGLPDLDRLAALREARHHELRAHPGDKAVAEQLRGK
ncbi:hypothetical protein [Cellulosimicrobium sp. I38E]|uniref:hypothetical protein n=1 Tax=Cellulosimicrobium sp. I38E TaxID=1393139 RepID=UPI000A5EAB40|nr:hypothetical protein [Cellulosimicrobium sp. I38E]